MSFLSAIKSFFGLSSAPKALQPGDKMLACEDCNTNFVFDAGEQRFFKEKGFTEPKRCPVCRKKVRVRMRRRGPGGNGRGQGSQQNNNRNNFQGNQSGNQNNHGRRNRHHGRRDSVIDGDSPYVDER